jgi:hypothetical protein
MRKSLLFTVATLALGFGGARSSHAQSRSATAAPGECDSLHAPARTELAAHYYASGVQIYRWSDSTWTLVGPDAVLFADARRSSKAGTHYAGPTWESADGGKVVGATARRCVPDATAIPWLSLDAVSSAESGILRRVTFIQRLHTAGGRAPSAPGHSADEEARVPYTAEYFFYRSK